MNSKTYKKNSMFNKYIYAIIAIVIMVAEIIGLVLLHNKDTRNNIDTNVNSQVEQEDSQNEDIETQSKEYYDFIDTEYGTFDFTEEEFISRYFKNIGNGKSYIEQGFERMEATIPNQYNYAAIKSNGINNLSIVTNPSNGKVENIKVAILSYNGGQISDEDLASLIANVIAGIMNVTSDDSNNTEVRNKVQQIFNEMTDGSSIEKGVQLTYKYDPIGQNGGDNSIELKVVVDDKAKGQKDSEKQNDNKTNTDETNVSTITPSSNSNTSISSSNNTTTSSSSNNISKNETVKVPDFSLGYELEYYTEELDSLGIKYKIVKGQDFDYEDNTVVKVEHNGENIEKGTTITITVADNKYDMNINVNTEYLVSKAGLSEDNSLKEVSLLLKINGEVVFNGTTPVENSMYEKSFGTYKGKPNNLNIEATIQGKTITLVRNVDYMCIDNYDNKYEIVINYCGGLG